MGVIRCGRRLNVGLVGTCGVVFVDYLLAGRMILATKKLVDANIAER